jgi:hypothetical protein
MNTGKLFQFSKASALLPAAGINYNTTAKNKMRGIDSNGKPTDFTADEKRKIELAFWEMVRWAGIEIRRDRAKVMDKTPKHSFTTNTSKPAKKAAAKKAVKAAAPKKSLGHSAIRKK